MSVTMIVVDKLMKCINDVVITLFVRNNACDQVMLYILRDTM